MSDFKVGDRVYITNKNQSGTVRHKNKNLYAVILDFSLNTVYDVKEENLKPAKLQYQTYNTQKFSLGDLVTFSFYGHGVTAVIVGVPASAYKVQDYNVVLIYNGNLMLVHENELNHLAEYKLGDKIKILYENHILETTVSDITHADPNKTIYYKLNNSRISYGVGAGEGYLWLNKKDIENHNESVAKLEEELKNEMLKPGQLVKFKSGNPKQSGKILYCKDATTLVDCLYVVDVGGQEIEALHYSLSVVEEQPKLEVSNMKMRVDDEDKDSELSISEIKLKVEDCVDIDCEVALKVLYCDTLVEVKINLENGLTLEQVTTVINFLKLKFKKIIPEEYTWVLYNHNH